MFRAFEGDGHILVGKEVENGIPNLDERVRDVCGIQTVRWVLNRVPLQCVGDPQPVV